jgi:hypothetical protein
MDNTYTPITASNISFTTLVTDLEAFTDTTSLTSSQIQWLLNYFTSSCSTAKSSSTTSSAAIPTLSASDVSGNEDGKIALHISDSVSNAKESLFTLITGVPDGATLSRGTYVSFLHSWIVKGSDIANLTITPPKNFSGDIQIDVMAIGMLNNKFSLTTTSFDVMVNEVADRPTLTVHSAHGYDNAPIDLDITGHAKDSSGEVLTYKITGVPDGATLNHGVHNLDGSWTLSASDVIGLQLTTSVIQEHLDLTVQAISTVASGANAGSTAITMKTLSVDVDHLKFTPVLVVSNVSGSEDAAISIDSNNAFHLDVKFLDKEGHEVNHDTGSYQNKLANTVIIVSGLPSGATLNHGALQTDGSYVLHYSDLSGLTLMPPHDFSGSMDLTVIAVYTRSPGMVNQVFTSLPSALHIDIGASADAPTLSVSDASGNEDTFISLNGHISAALTDNSENLSIHISGVPAGATMMGATFDSVSGDYIVNDLSILAIKPPTDSEVDFNLTIKAISTEPSNGNSATTTALLHVDVQAVADAPSVFVDTVTQHFIEGNAIAIGSYIHGALAPNEVIEGDEALKYLISNLPVGASLVGFTPDVNGVYSIDSMQLADLMLDPGASFVGAISLSVQTEAIENSNGDLAFSANTATLSLIIDPSVSAPTLSVANAIGDEDTTIGLVISGALTGTNTTGETLTFDISNVPSGSILHVTSGDLIADVNGVYHVPSSEIGSLTITPPLDFEGSISLSVIATATEGMFSASSSAQTLGIDVHPMAEIPMLSVGSNALSMDENHTVDLSIGLATPGHTLDGVDDTLFVKIMGVTDGAVLSAGTFDSASGAWTVASTALGGLYLTPASDFDGSLHLTVVGYSTDGTGTLLSSSSTGVETLDITINPVAETPILSLGSATISTTEDHTIDLSIDLTQQPELSHDDILYVKIAGVGSAYALSAGTFDSGSGEWTVDSTALGGLHLIPNSGSEFDGMMNLSVIGYAQDGAAVAMTGMQNIAISVAGVAEAPVLSVSDVIIGAVSSVGSGSLTDVSAAKAASNDSMAVVGPGGNTVSS